MRNLTRHVSLAVALSVVTIGILFMLVSAHARERGASLVGAQDVERGVALSGSQGVGYSNPGNGGAVTRATIVVDDQGANAQFPSFLIAQGKGSDSGKGGGKGQQGPGNCPSPPCPSQLTD